MWDEAPRAHVNGTDTGDTLLRRGSTPFVRLVDAAAYDLGLHGDPRTALIGRSTVMGYLYLRLQDDLAGEEALVDRGTVYAMEAALSSHLELLVRAGVPSDVLVKRSELMTRFAAFAAIEVDERDDDDETAARRIGEKFLGMAVPLIALAGIAGRPAIYDSLASLVIELGTALQLITDVLNAPEDHAAGRTTPLLRALYRAGFIARGSLEPIRRTELVGHPAVTLMLEIAVGAIGRAEGQAASLELSHVGALVTGMRAVVQQTRERQQLGKALGLSRATPFSA